MSCTEDGIIGNGITVSDERILSDFQEVEIDGIYNVTITQGEEFKITLEGDENIVDRMIVDVSDERLEVRLEEGNYDDFDLTVDIICPSIRLFDKGGIGNATITDFEGLERLEINQAGAGNISISGSVEMLEFNHTNVGDFEGFDFIANQIQISQSGIGNAEVYCESSLTGSLSGIGNILYKGSPSTIDIERTGIGEVIDAN